MRRDVAQFLLASVAGIAIAAPALAADPQASPATGSADAGVTPTNAQASTNATPENLQDIVVTGTRIVRDGYTAPTPVTVASTEELSRTTPSSIPDALNKLPQFANSLSPSKASLNFSNSPIHGNVLNLRGLGTTGNNPKGPLRTLILFDGIRVSPTEYVGTVDTNVLPQLLIQRVDVVTGGASASWGSDAVAGVVNFILDKNFTGIKGVVQGGSSSHGDNVNQRVGLAGGWDFNGGRGHVLVSGEYYNNDGMLRSDRKSATQGWTYVGATPGGGAPGTATNPYVATPNVLISALAPNGRITGASNLANPLIGQVINNDGTTRPFNTGTAVGTAGFQQGGDGYGIPFNNNAVAPQQNYSTFARTSYDLTDNITAYAQGVFTRTKLRYSTQQNALVPPSGAVNIYKGNPYLTAAEDATLATATDFLTVGQTQAGQALPIANDKTDYWMATAGLQGKFGEFTWTANYTHGDSKHTLDNSGLYNNKRLYAAVDAVRDPATGNITCRVLLDPTVAAQYQGCQPLNVLNGNPQRSTPLGYAYATGTSSYEARLKQDSVQANISGSVFELPAGPVDVAFGVEYRKQSLNLVSNADPSTLAGSTAAATSAIRSAYFAGERGVPAGALYYWLTNVGSANGSLNVKEAYGEIAVPILKDAPFAKELSLNAAGRITDYSASGTVETWKAGATWRPIDQLLLRGTYSRDIRAPNLFELYAGQQSGIGIVNDVKNAAGNYGSGINQNVSSLTGGNPNLKPEVAKTYTFGGVVSPVTGLSLSVDYYHIKVDKLIDSLSAQQILTNCLNAGGAGAPECSLIDRTSPTAFPTLVRIAPANIAFLETAGIDFDASYRMSLGEGALGLRLYANYLDKFKAQQYAGAPVLNYTGISIATSNPAGYPRWRGQLTVDYSNGPFGITVNEQYIGKMTIGIPGAPSVFVDPKVKPVAYTDVTLRYTPTTSAGNMELFATVNNLLNKKAPLIPSTIPGVNLPTNIAIYDFIGTTYTAGVRFKF